MEGIDPSQLQQMGGGDPNAAAKAAEQKAAQEEQRAGTGRRGAAAAAAARARLGGCAGGLASVRGLRCAATYHGDCLEGGGAAKALRCPRARAHHKLDRGDAFASACCEGARAAATCGARRTQAAQHGADQMSGHMHCVPRAPALPRDRKGAGVGRWRLPAAWPRTSFRRPLPQPCR